MKLTKSIVPTSLAALLVCIFTLHPLVAPAAELEEKDFTPEFVAQCKSRAEAGETDGQALYARALVNGWGVEKNGKEAYEWSRKAADAGSPCGMGVLGFCYDKGYGVEKDMAKAVEWYRKAAELGYAPTMFNLGICYFNGDGVEKDMAKAVEWYRKAAELGNAYAMNSLGYCYFKGEGVAKDPAKAVEWHRKAAELGNAYAMNSLGYCYDNGEGVAKDAAKAVEWYRKAAELGNAYAMNNLGNRYVTGEGVAKDAAKAAEWWRKAAELGNTAAMFTLGNCYFNGDGVKKDMAKAVEWWRKAAELGDADAMHNLAVCYEYGGGVEKDMSKAEYWMEKEKEARAAKADVSWAMRGKNASTNAAADTPAAIEAEWKAAIENATRITTAPRMVGANAEKGEGLLEAFGTRYMPNAYAAYQKARETAKEREQLLRENIPNGRESDSTGGGLYDKIAKNTAKAVAEMLRHHDELCHFFVLHRAGGVTDEQLAEIDSAKIAVRLPGESLVIGEGKGTVKTPTAEELTFAAKYLPEIHQANQTLRNDLDAKERDYAALRADAIAMDAARTWDVFCALSWQLWTIRHQINNIPPLLKEERLLHAVGDRTSEQLADIDQKKSLAIREFRKTLPDAMSFNGIPVSLETFALIPGRDFLLAKTEVTQEEWQSLMGFIPGEGRYRPCFFKGANNPVQYVSQELCQEFVKRLNAATGIKTYGFEFRLPSMEEWTYACRAGATGDYCKLWDGTEVTEKTLGKVAWYQENSNDQIHPVGQKEPNAWGLYDMIGNVREWSGDPPGIYVDYGNGCYRDSAKNCKSTETGGTSPINEFDFLGFRICVSPIAE